MARLTSQAKQNDFTQGRIGTVIMRMAIPMMLAQLVNVLYNIVDRMYIGHIPNVGSLALTGLGLTVPLVSLITAFANLCGTGGGPLCSIARGKGDKEYAEKVMGNALCLLLIFGVTLTVLLQIFMKPIIMFFGASSDTYPFAQQYARVYLMGTVFAMISLGMNSFINAQGFAKMGMLTVMVGAVVNIILDPVFIFVLKLGIMGAAWATVIAQLCSAAWVMKFLLSKKAILDLKAENLKLNGEVVAKMLGLGVTGFVMSITNCAVQAVYNVTLHSFGGDIYVGAMTVVNSVRDLIHMILQGIASGAQPVLGYNFGAKAYERVKAGIRFITAVCLIYTVIAWTGIQLGAEWLVRIFNSEPELVAVGVPALKIYFAGLVVASLQMIGQCVFVGLGRAKYAVFFSMLRKIVLVVPFVLILPRIGMGVQGVYWSEPFSDLIGAVACFATMYVTVYRRLGKELQSK